jgi:hypothetical protein
MRSFILIEVQHDHNSAVESLVKDLHAGLLDDHGLAFLGVHTKGPLREATAGRGGYSIPAESLNTVTIYEP